MKVEISESKRDLKCIELGDCSAAIVQQNNSAVHPSSGCNDNIHNRCELHKYYQLHRSRIDSAEQSYFTTCDKNEETIQHQEVV